MLSMKLAFYSYLLSYTSKWEEKNIGVLLFFCHEDIPWPRILIEARVFGGLEMWEKESMPHMVGDTQNGSGAVAEKIYA